jgi:hypothetical protein
VKALSRKVESVPLFPGVLSAFDYFFYLVREACFSRPGLRLYRCYYQFAGCDVTNAFDLEKAENVGIATRGSYFYFDTRWCLEMLSDFVLVFLLSGNSQEHTFIILEQRKL